MAIRPGSVMGIALGEPRIARVMASESLGGFPHPHHQRDRAPQRRAQATGEDREDPELPAPLSSNVANSPGVTSLINRFVISR